MDEDEGREMREVISYLLYRLGCAHPFRISRILLLAEWRAKEELGRRITDLKYVMEEFGFYVEGLKDFVDQLIEKGCAEKIEEEKCIRYLCDEPALPDDVREILDEVIEEVKDLDDRELNKLVIRDPRYGEEL